MADRDEYFVYPDGIDGYTVVFGPDPLYTHHVFKPGDSPWSHYGNVASFRAVGMGNSLDEMIQAVRKHQAQVAELERLKSGDWTAPPAAVCARNRRWFRW